MRLFICVLAVAVLGGICAAPARPGPPQAVKDRKQPNPDRLIGMKAAIADIEAGKLKLKSPPELDTHWNVRYVELLKQECGVEWETVTGIHTSKQVAEMSGYNDVMRVEIKDRFGPDILDKLRKKAEAEWRKSESKT
jgi:hypothetical protein